MVAPSHYNLSTWEAKAGELTGVVRTALALKGRLPQGEKNDGHSLHSVEDQEILKNLLNYSCIFVIFCKI